MVIGRSVGSAHSAENFWNYLSLGLAVICAIQFIIVRTQTIKEYL